MTGGGLGGHLVYPVAHTNPTEIQQKVFDLYHPADGPSMSELGRELGISKARVHRAYHQVCKKLKITPKGKDEPLRPNGIETHEPEKSAKAMISLSLPKKIRPSIEEIARKCGLSKSAVDSLSRQLKTQLWPLKEEIGEIALKEYSNLLMTNAWNIAASIDEESIREAGLKDRAIALGILTDKALLVQGKPTEIHEHGAHGKLDDLLGAVAQALQRRGIALPPPTITVPSEAVT